MLVGEVFQVEVKTVDVVIPVLVEDGYPVGVVVRGPDDHISSYQVLDRDNILVCRFNPVHS